jgi:AbrB family looped-hinge helix DNA binding protein
MLAELRAKSQVTIPKELVEKMGLSEGDKLDVFEKDGAICLLPVAVYPKQYIADLRKEINETKSKIASGEQPVFDTVDAMFNKLEGKS